MKRQTRSESLYNQIAQKLIADIKIGVYKPGDRLPSENELAAQHGVHRLTARQAITALVEKDLVYRLQGSGAFVKEEKIDYNLTFNTNFTQNLLNIGYLPSQQIISSKVTRAGAQLAELLQTRPGNSIIQVKFLRTAISAMTEVTGSEINPLCVSVSYLLSDKFPELPVLIFQAHSLYSLLKNHYRVHPRRSSTHIEAEPASREDARLLQISLHTPVLITRSLVRDQYDYLFEYTVSRFRSDRITLEVFS